MIYRKLIYLLPFLFISNLVFSQSTTKKKLEHSFMIGLNYNTLQSDNTGDGAETYRKIFELNRNWQSKNQPSLAVGYVLKSHLTGRLATQVEFNLVSTRQKAAIDETKTIDNNLTATRGTVQFSAVYLQIPVVFAIKLTQSSNFEIGLVQMFEVHNFGNQNLSKTIFSEQKDSRFVPNNNPIITYSPAKVVAITDKPNLFRYTVGALVGVNYRINEKIAVRLRYERELENFSQYGDLFQSRFLLSLLLKK
jgi:Outer membrane protein beta-barrel domain